jgi:hypothetical protein
MVAAKERRLMGTEVYGLRQWHVADDWLQRDGLTLLGRQRDYDGPKVIRFQLALEKVEEGTYISGYDTGLYLTRDDAQQIINELWRCGMRPRDGSGALAHVEAQQAHMDDLRTILFNALKIKRPV